jgi:hypothetical protein
MSPASISLVCGLVEIGELSSLSRSPFCCRHRVLAVTDLQVVQEFDGASESSCRTKSRKLQHNGDVVGGVASRPSLPASHNPPRPLPLKRLKTRPKPRCGCHRR